MVGGGQIKILKCDLLSDLNAFLPSFGKTIFKSYVYGGEKLLYVCIRTAFLCKSALSATVTVREGSGEEL